MNLCNLVFVRPADPPLSVCSSVLLSKKKKKKKKKGHHTQNVQSNLSCCPCFSVLSSCLYHFIPLSVALTLAEGHKVSGKVQPAGFIFLAHFSTDQSQIAEAIQAQTPLATKE